MSHIAFEITRQDYKRKPYWQVRIIFDGGHSKYLSLDSLDEAHAWIREKTDSILSAPTREDEPLPPQPTHFERVRDAGYDAGDPKGYSVP